MATVNSNNQSYLEMQGIEARKEQMARSDYNQSNEYNERHNDALADGDGQGKGTGDFGGHGFTVPDMTKPKDQISYSNFNTTGAGNDCDQKARETMLARSIYNADNQYGIDVIIDTSANVAEGQYYGAGRSRLPYTCPIV